MIYIFYFRNWNGHHWAQPKINHLKDLLRQTYGNPDEVKLKGIVARKDMIEKYSLEVIANQLLSHIQRIREILKSRPNANILYSEL